MWSHWQWQVVPCSESLLCCPRQLRIDPSRWCRHFGHSSVPPSLSPFHHSAGPCPLLRHGPLQPRSRTGGRRRRHLAGTGNSTTSPVGVGTTPPAGYSHHGRWRRLQRRTETTVVSCACPASQLPRAGDGRSNGLHRPRNRSHHPRHCAASTVRLHCVCDRASTEYDPSL